MDWVVETEAERTVLKRIVVLLYSLADLAEQASGRSLVTRHLVLGFLRLAESVAWEMMVSRQLCAPAPELLGTERSGDGEAMRLARRFRELASALEGLVALIFVAGYQSHACLSQLLKKMTLAMRSRLDRRAKRPDCKPVVPFDTS